MAAGVVRIADHSDPVRRCGGGRFLIAVVHDRVVFHEVGCDLPEKVFRVTLRDLGGGRGKRCANVVDGTEPEFNDAVDRDLAMQNRLREI